MKFKVVSNVRLFTSYSIDSNFKTKLLVKMASKSERFAILTGEDRQEIIDNKNF